MPTNKATKYVGEMWMCCRLNWKPRTAVTKTPLTCKMQKIAVKAILISLYEFVPAQHTVNRKSDKQTIKRLIAWVHRVRPEFQESRSRCLLHDRAWAHSSNAFSEFLAKRAMPVLSHLSYSPDLAPVEFFLFPNLKKCDERDKNRGWIIDATDCGEGTVGRYEKKRFLGHSIQLWAM